MRAHEALDDYAALIVERMTHRELMSGVWELRDSMTAYDAAYVALAEALDALRCAATGDRVTAPFSAAKFQARRSVRLVRRLTVPQ